MNLIKEIDNILNRLYWVESEINSLCVKLDSIKEDLVETTIEEEQK